MWGGGYNTVAIAVSGTKELKISVSYKYAKGGNINEYECTDTMLSFNEFVEKFNQKDKQNIEVSKKRICDLQEKISKALTKAGNLTPDKRVLLVSACLLAIRDKTFADNYQGYTDRVLIGNIVKAVDTYIAEYGIDRDKARDMMQSFETLNRIDMLTDRIEIEGKSLNLAKYILDCIKCSDIDGISTPKKLGLDVINNGAWEFYSSIVTYAQHFGDAKNGFVITPQHICELFTEIANIDTDTKVVDMCFGTGGFLVAAIKKEAQLANGDADKIREIKENNIYGVELDNDRFTYGCVNMILRGDGQSKMFKGDCFKIKGLEGVCSVGFINPPYNLAINEMTFVQNLLSHLTKGGTGICIVPTGCCTNKNSGLKSIREEILRNNTLEGVMTVRNDLFKPVSATTCIMVFTAGKKHPDDKETWFADFTDDGFIWDRKKRALVDQNNTWEDKCKQWVKAYRNRDVIDGFSLKRHVTADDEWSYEAYKSSSVELKDEDFIKVIKEYALYELQRGENTYE